MIIKCEQLKNSELKRLSAHCLFSLSFWHTPNIEKTHSRKIIYFINLSNFRVKSLAHYKIYRK